MNRIKELREKAGKQQKELAIDLGVSQPTVSDWESGRKIPSAKSTSKIADYFQVPIDYLLGREPTPEGAPAPSRPGSKWIPVLGRVAAGTPIEAVEDILDYEEIDAKTAASGECFALQIKGQSMEPNIAT